MRVLKRASRLFLLLFAAQVLRAAACSAPARADSEARLAYVARRIDEGTLPGVAPGPPFDGEWRLVTLSMGVVAATNLAFRYPEDRAARATQVAAWTRVMLEANARRFDTQEWGGRDALATLDGADGHAGYLGHLALALGALCVLQADQDTVDTADAVATHDAARLHRAVVDALARRIDAAPSGLIETYPGETYVPDNVVAMAGVALFDTCHGSAAHAATVSRWTALVRRRADGETGVLAFAAGQRGRGSGAAWNALYLPFIDTALAREQRAALWRAFEVRLPLGGAAVREWPPGVERSGDADSGPLVFGLSPAASGFAMSAAAIDGDEARLAALSRVAELVGVTVGVTERRFLFAPLVGDASVLAARTATRWDRRFVTDRSSR